MKFPADRKTRSRMNRHSSAYWFLGGTSHSVHSVIVCVHCFLRKSKRFNTFAVTKISALIRLAFLVSVAIWSGLLDFAAVRSPPPWGRFCTFTPARTLVLIAFVIIRHVSNGSFSSVQFSSVLYGHVKHLTMPVISLFTRGFWRCRWITVARFASGWNFRGTFGGVCQWK